jgi:hypothetical protein
MMVLQESQFADQLPAFQLTSLADRTHTEISPCLIDAVGALILPHASRAHTAIHRVCLHILQSPFS